VLVLEEAETRLGKLVRRAIATQVATGPAAGKVPPIPDGDRVVDGPEAGATRRIDPSAPLPYVTSYVLPAPPAGYTLFGRYAVVPPGASGDYSLVADVYTSGAEVIIVDQGASRSGAAPFDVNRPRRRVVLPGFGSPESVLDFRANEVRGHLPDGGFIRVIGTRPLSELLAVARSVQPQPRAAA
jgi:hypothetical protein